MAKTQIEPMTMEELFRLPPAFDLKVLARALGFGMSKMYRYAKAREVPGDPPVPIHQYDGEYRAYRTDLFRHLGLDPAAVAAPVPVQDIAA